jgi:hypothetical protein
MRFYGTIFHNDKHLVSVLIRFLEVDRTFISGFPITSECKSIKPTELYHHSSIRLLHIKIGRFTFVLQFKLMLIMN